jgi:hypothetical protein
MAAFLSYISLVHMGPWPVRGRYQAKQVVSRNSTKIDKSCDGTKIRTHDIADLDPKSALYQCAIDSLNGHRIIESS